MTENKQRVGGGGGGGRRGGGGGGGGEVGDQSGDLIEQQQWSHDVATSSAHVCW